MATARARDPGISSSLPPRLHSIWSDEAWEDEEDDSPVLQPRRATENSSPAALSRRATDPTLPHGLHLEFMDIPWFHPTLTRHQAEAELLQSEVGVYLLRPRFDKVNGSIKGYSVDVKCQHSVKHFQLSVTKQCIKFGQEMFKNTEALLKHFDNCPLIGDDTGKLFVLRHGYPRDINEIPDYSRVTTHYVQDPKNKNGKKKVVRPASTAATGSDSPKVTYSFGTKEGHLSKMGGRVKTWKTRWFVLRNEELSYYENEKDKNPIRTIKLREATSVSACEREDTDRKNVFKLVLPWRTFFLQATMPEIMEDWIRILDFKLKEIKQAQAGLLRKGCPSGSPRTRSETT